MRLQRYINQNFFKTWTAEMSYVLGYIVADGCITVSKGRKKKPFSLNITSTDKKHLHKIREVLRSNHKITKKSGGTSNFSYQLQFRNPILTNDLIALGVLPRKTHNLNPIETSEQYFPDFVRGFFDGDGTVYIYKVNDTLQIKVGFVSVSLPFITKFNQQVCASLNIPQKTIHKTIDKRRNKMTQYNICFYVDDCQRLANFMYSNNTSLYLFRKRQVFKKWQSIKRRHYIKQNYPSKVGWRLNQKVST